MPKILRKNEYTPLREQQNMYYYPHFTKLFKDFKLLPLSFTTLD